MQMVWFRKTVRFTLDHLYLLILYCHSLFLPLLFPAPRTICFVCSPLSCPPAELTSLALAQSVLKWLPEIPSAYIPRSHYPALSLCKSVLSGDGMNWVWNISSWWMLGRFVNWRAAASFHKFEGHLISCFLLFRKNSLVARTRKHGP